MRGTFGSRLAAGYAFIVVTGLCLLTGCQGVSSGSQSSNPANPSNPTSGTLAISPASLSFGNVAVGGAASLTGTLTAGSSDVTVSSASWDGSGYSVSGITFPITVPAGKSTTYTVTFTPPAAGSSSGSIAFLSNASDSPLGQSFTGDGTAGGGPSGHSVSLSWNPSSSSVVGYNIYRGTQSGGPYTKLNSSPETTMAFIDYTVASGTTYYYVATAVNSDYVESGYSNQAVAQVPSP
jgi:hypothetical protein